MASLVIAAAHPPDELWEGFTRFIPRLNYRDRSALVELPVTATAVSKPLLQAGLDRQLVLGLRHQREHRVVLEAEAWRNQRPRRARAKEFNRLGNEISLPAQLDPATLRSSPAETLVRYTEAFLVAEEARQADALVLPSHLAGGHGEPAREGELRLAEAGVQLVRSQGFAERGERPKPLLVGVTVEVAAIASPLAAAALARSYAALGGDGYWVQLAGFTEATQPETVSLAASFLFALQELSGRRVIAVDGKNLSWPLLAAGLWGSCIGVGGREQFDGPPDADARESRAVQPTVVHPRLLRSFQAKSEPARLAFERFPCACGVHAASEVPTEKPAIRRHALRVRLEMTRAATSGAGVGEVQTAVVDAGWAAGELGLAQPQVAAYQAVFDAVDWRVAAAE